MTARFHLKARAEYIAAYVWYEKKLTGLGDRFMEAVEKRLSQIIANPSTYAPKENSRFREIKVQRFPYIIVYEIMEKESFIHIAAIYHGKRNPAKKFRNL